MNPAPNLAVPNSVGPRLAVFDVDGTMIDSQHNIVAAMTLACQTIGLEPPTAGAIRRIIGLSLTEAMTRLVPEATESTLRQMVDAYKDAFAALRLEPDHQEPLFPGVIATLDALRGDGWLLAVATGKSRRGVRAMIERHDLADRFISVQTADDNPSKPHPAMLRRAILESGGQPMMTAMIGDTSYDMTMARSAGARAIGVAWGYHGPDELRAAGAELVVDSYAELFDSLSALFDRR